MRLTSASRDCKQRSLTVSKEAPTVSKQVPRLSLKDGHCDLVDRARASRIRGPAVVQLPVQDMQLLLKLLDEALSSEDLLRQRLVSTLPQYEGQSRNTSSWAPSGISREHPGDPNHYKTVAMQMGGVLRYKQMGGVLQALPFPPS